MCVSMYYCIAERSCTTVLPTDEAVFVRPLLYLIYYLLYVDISYILGDEHRYGLLEENKMNE
jgi:hypothetical protein